mmetsp:Transcript_41935/g.64194  ORF Transcript_41935/g.64194 Transcript_41935/m.64194 type:complete len:98 (+) Transcript_41935:895-1188(+)
MSSNAVLSERGIKILNPLNLPDQRKGSTWANAPKEPSKFKSSVSNNNQPDNSVSDSSTDRKKSLEVKSFGHEETANFQQLPTVLTKENIGLKGRRNT